MSVEGHCLRCGHDDETGVHAVNDYLFPKTVWMFLMPSQYQVRFFTLPIDEWLKWNLKNSVAWFSRNTPLNSLFSIICWLLWKNRNLLVFSDRHSCVQDIVDTGVSWMWSFVLAGSEPSF